MSRLPRTIRKSIREKSKLGRILLGQGVHIDDVQKLVFDFYECYQKKKLQISPEKVKFLQNLGKTTKAEIVSLTHEKLEGKK